jgi:hypothetical protein
MKPLNTQPLPDQKEKMQFVFDQAEKALDTTTSAYDALTTKAFTLFSVEVGVVSLLIGFLAVSGLSAPLGWVALVYAGFLTASGWQCWKAMAGKDFFHIGRTPYSFSTPELNQTLPTILDRQCIKHQERIKANREKVNDCAVRLQNAMSLFLWGTVLSLIITLATAAAQNVVVGIDRGRPNLIQQRSFRGWWDGGSFVRWCGNHG